MPMYGLKMCFFDDVNYNVSEIGISLESANILFVVPMHMHCFFNAVCASIGIGIFSVKRSVCTSSAL